MYIAFFVDFGNEVNNCKIGKDLDFGRLAEKYVAGGAMPRAISSHTTSDNLVLISLKANEVQVLTYIAECCSSLFLCLVLCNSSRHLMAVDLCMFALSFLHLPHTSCHRDLVYPKRTSFHRHLRSTHLAD